MYCHNAERKYMQPMQGHFQIKQPCFKTGWHGLLKKFRKASEKEKPSVWRPKQAAVLMLHIQQFIQRWARFNTLLLDAYFILKQIRSSNKAPSNGSL
jgi:hypothetical protein